MKKIIGLSVIGMTLLLASCGKNEQVTSSKTSQSTVQTRETTTTTVLETATSDSNTETVVKETNSTVTTTPASSTDQNTKTSVTDSSTNVTSESAFTPEQKQALDAIYAKYPEYKDSDIAFIFWEMIDGDYLFKAYSLSASERGGSGTLTFFRVSPVGEVQETDPSGNPY
ncbi:hypothetical protein PF023_10020 [Enterococcus thailandicus]|uniref:hypothetical protein n=1 Tax=Enterococcus thailandicus TaxID=417368 RepID=UPI0022EBDE60|nr:hypothetical protein [Enterococcus thailandicus]MDA3974384.1 hypothetical protein [Enterococcus thailandicus]MDA3976871.1 hypothetical protein [Enterococcus thailandicus]MDA3981837.1 hypothetical protein [Enterococcus thailandicus]